MSFNLENLDEEIRGLMIEELELDVTNDGIYFGNRLNDHGKSQYPEILKKAILNGNCETLTEELRDENYWNETEPRNTKNGIKYYKVPRNASQLLSEGEFNRYYIRAMCKKAISDELDLVVYRAKQVRNPRPDSQAILGKSVDPKLLLEDLRINMGKTTILGVPAGPNSGLSVKFR